MNTFSIDPITVMNSAEATVKSFIKSQRGAVSMCEDDINEIVQRVCLKAYTREETYNPERGCLATWVSTMTRTTTYDFLKERSYRGRWAEGSDPVRFDGRVALSPSDTYEINEAIGFAEAYSEELGEIKQKIFRLMMDEVPNKEIARECNMTESAVNAVICRMRADLRNKLRRLNSFYGPMNCAC